MVSVYRGTMTDAPEATEAVEMPSLPITFRGREMYVVMPNPTQLAVWKRILQRLQNTHEADWTAEAVVDSLAKLVRIVETLLVEQVDRSWLEDELLDGTLDFPKLAPIITLATEAFQQAAEGNNRESRRAAAKKTPAKKAALKTTRKRTA